MAGSLNIKILNNVTEIAQGDTASTVIVELLDENRLPIYTLDGEDAQINLIDKNGDIQQQFNTFVFDSIVEFNLESTIPIGSYRVEIRISIDDYLYVFPSQVDYIFKINKSANDFYNATIHADGTEVVANVVLEKFSKESGGILEHVGSRNNPHNVTKTQVGLGNVDNTKQASKTEFDNHNSDTTKHITASERSAWNAKETTSGAQAKVNAHEDKKTNPHDVTKAQVGLGNVDNVKQASNSDFLNHVNDDERHLTQADRDKLDGIGGGGGLEVIDIPVDILYPTHEELSHIAEVKLIGDLFIIVDIAIYFDVGVIATTPIFKFKLPKVNGKDLKALRRLDVSEDWGLTFTRGKLNYNYQTNEHHYLAPPSGLEEGYYIEINGIVQLTE